MILEVISHLAKTRAALCTGWIKNGKKKHFEAALFRQVHNIFFRRNVNFMMEYLQIQTLAG
jgi:hypothetical protein